MKTPTPQEQAEMLIEKPKLKPTPTALKGAMAKISKRAIAKRMATKAAIVTVEEIIKAQPLKNGTKKDGLKYWQEVLTILKGKL